VVELDAALASGVVADAGVGVIEDSSRILVDANSRLNRAASISCARRCASGSTAGPAGITVFDAAPALSMADRGRRHGGRAAALAAGCRIIARQAGQSIGRGAMIGAVKLFGRGVAMAIILQGQNTAPDTATSAIAAPPVSTLRDSRVTRGRAGRSRKAATGSLAGLIGSVLRPRFARRSPQPPVSARDTDGLLMLATKPQLGGAEQPVDDIIVLPHAIIDELAVAFRPMTNSGGASPCAIPRGISI